MTTEQKMKAIREELKELGFSNRQIAVKKSYCTYDVSIDIFFKFKPSDKLFKKVESIARKYKEIDYCEVSGEILGGGNTYVNVSIDWRVENSAENFKLGDSFYFLELKQTYRVYHIREGIDPKIYLNTYDTPKGHPEEQAVSQSFLKKMISDNRVRVQI